jgi:branched-chain amino acid transport system ATP-binding protein
VAVPETTERVLDVAELDVRYSGVAAVKGVTFHVNRGEAVGLIGPNGAGKSTTLLALMGVVKASGGTATFAGESLLGKVPETIVRRGVALVPEGRQIFGQLSVHDNLRLGLVANRHKASAADAMRDVLDLFPILGEFRSRPAGLLSGGQQQQLAIGRALLSRPDLLMLDEPSLGLSPTVVDTVFDALEAVKKRGTSILVVEQRAEFTIAFADRTYVLHQGNITLELTPDASDDEALLTEAYFGS